MRADPPVAELLLDVLGHFHERPKVGASVVPQLIYTRDPASKKSSIDASGRLPSLQNRPHDDATTRRTAECDGAGEATRIWVKGEDRVKATGSNQSG